MAVMGLILLLVGVDARGEHGGSPGISFGDASDGNFEQAVEEASELSSYRFVSRVEIVSGTRRQVIQTQGQVRDSGTGAPELFASVSGDTGRLDVLRLVQGAWTRTQGGDWRPITADTQGGVRARRLSDILGAIQPDTTERQPDGSTRVTGTISAEAVGIRGVGSVPVEASLDPSGRLVRLDYEASISRAGTPVRLFATTEFGDFDVALDWPAPPA